MKIHKRLMRPKCLIVLLLVALFALALTGWPGVGYGYTKPLDQIMLETEYLTDQIHIFQDTGRMSSDDIYGVYVDLSQISNNTVTAAVYQTNAQEKTLTTYTNIKAQPIEGVNGAKDKLCRFFFYLRNNDRDNPMALWGSAPYDTVLGYVYGERKAEILNTFVTGIPECLEQQRLYDNSGGGGSSTKTPEETVNPEAWAEKYLTTTFTLSTTTYTTTTANGTTKTISMDVEPYVKDGRTYVPVRYLAYSLGVAEDDIAWSQESQQVTITLRDTTVLLTIGNNVMLVNGKPIKMDVAPEIVDGRTMLPARWVAEALGATVEWDESLNQAVIIMPTE